MAEERPRVPPVEKLIIEPAAPADEAAKPAVDNRWWVDMGSARRKSERTEPTEGGEKPGPTWVMGSRLFRTDEGFDPDRARSHLSGSNLEWLREANPPENGWAYLKLTDDRPREDVVERVRKAIRLPRGARAVLLDSGPMLRAIVTGMPIGERVCEISLGSECCLDAFVRGEWVCERVFRGREQALREVPDLLEHYLSDAD